MRSCEKTIRSNPKSWAVVESAASHLAKTKSRQKSAKDLRCLCLPFIFLFFSADGLVSAGETKDLQCLVCESSDDSSDCALGNLQRTRCPPNMHYCKSTVSYYITDRKDLTYKGRVRG